MFFRVAVSPYPGIGILSRLDMQGRNMITGVIEGTPAQQAGLLAGDVIVFADGAPFEPVQSFRGKVGKEVVLGLRACRRVYANIGYSGRN